MNVANPIRTVIKDAVQAVPEEEMLYGVFNDPEVLEPMFASGRLHPFLREKLLEEPLWTSPLPGPAKRFMKWTNEQRAMNPVNNMGQAVLREQRIVRTPWRTIEGTELEAINDGRRANS